MTAAAIFVTLALAAAGGLAATNPAYAAATVGIVGFAVLLYRVGPWRGLYATTLILMLCATSSQPMLAAASYYPRYAAVAALAVVTCFAKCETPRPLSKVPRAARVLVRGMFLAVGVAVVSVAWSVDRLLTVQQTVALAALAVTLYALVRRRWTNRETIYGDLAVSYWVLAGFFALGIAAWAAGLPGTESVGGFDGVAYSDVRFQGLIDNPNMLSMVVVPSVPLGWTLYRRRRQAWVLLGMVPGLSSVLLSQSRTAVLALVIAGLIVLVRSGLGRAAQVAIAAAAAATFVYYAGLAETLASSNVTEDFSARFARSTGGDAFGGRSLVWAETIGMISEQPGGGYGYAAGPSLFTQLRASGDLGFPFDVAHNSYLQWTLETGVVGLPVLLILVAACVWAVIRGEHGVAWCAGAGLLLQLTESAMLGTGQAYPYIFWPAVVAGCLLAPERTGSVAQAGLDLVPSGRSLAMARH